MMKHEAIYNLYSNVVSVREDKDGTITALDINNNAVSINIDNVNAKATELQTSYDNEQKTKNNNKVSAYRKNSLTDDEILAIDSNLKDYL
mgnify:CR=1 FL=1